MQFKFNPLTAQFEVTANVGCGNVANSTKNTFNEVTSVASGVTTTVATYTVPAGKSGVLERIWVSGENIAFYEIYVNATRIDAGRTYFGGALNIEFPFMSMSSGVALAAGDVVSIKVTHTRPMLANFEGRIQVIEIG